MMSLRKIGAIAALIVASLGFTSFSANAVLITQSISFSDSDMFFPGEEIGSITLELDESLIGSGIVYVTDYVSLDIFGSTLFDVFQFDAAIDATSYSSIYSGIEYLLFDVLELENDEWSYSMYYDSFDADFSTFDIFDENGDVVYYSSFGGVELGSAQVVSAPASFAILALGLVAMMVRRRKS